MSFKHNIQESFILLNYEVKEDNNRIDTAGLLSD